jgi:3-phosphoshikimate 1-carboxyvinyltransferase
MRHHQYRSHKISSLNGTARIAGDKSMSHRALMIGALATGETMISGLLESADIRATASALSSMGVKLGQAPSGLWIVNGKGSDHLSSPDHIIDLGNSGTSARLLAGLIGGSNVTATITGDTSLNRRPMGRVLEPLTEMGVQALARDNTKLPLTLRGAKAMGAVKAIDYTMPVASAQVKSAILLAALQAEGTTTIREPIATRDHTENMLRAFGVNLHTENNIITIDGGQNIMGRSLDIPADPSAAAFIVAASLLSPTGEVTLKNIGFNPTRIGFFKAIERMGANITYSNQKTIDGEARTDMTITCGQTLNGLTLEPEEIPSLIDEIPILAVLAACAHSKSHFKGLKELRVKESDRLTRMADGLNLCGVTAEIIEDDLIIHANGTIPAGNAFIETALDHRIAMAFLILGTISDGPITIDDARPISTSFPDFIKVMNGLGAQIHQENEPHLLDWDQ